MKTETAFDMIRDLGKAFRTACIERGYEPKGGWDGDLMSGLAGFVKLELTDKDIPGITEAYTIVMAKAAKLCFETAQQAAAEDFIADQDTVDQVTAGNTA
jgi:hypothetical protein